MFERSIDDVHGRVRLLNGIVMVNQVREEILIILIAEEPIS